MAMNSATLKAAIKSRLLTLFNDMRTTEYTETQYADALAGIIAEETVSHIQTLGQVNSGIAVQVSLSTGTGATTATGTIT